MQQGEGATDVCAAAEDDDGAAAAKGCVEHTICVVTREAEGVGTEPATRILPSGCSTSARDVIVDAEVGEHEACAAKCGVEFAIGVEAGEAEVEASAAVIALRHDHELAVGLNGEGVGDVTVDGDEGRGDTVSAERDVEHAIGAVAGKARVGDDDEAGARHPILPSGCTAMA